MPPINSCKGKITQYEKGRYFKKKTDKDTAKARQYEGKMSLICIQELYPNNLPEKDEFKKYAIIDVTIFTYNIGNIPKNIHTDNGIMLMIYLTISSLRKTSLRP